MVTKRNGSVNKTEAARQLFAQLKAKNGGTSPDRKTMVEELTKLLKGGPKTTIQTLVSKVIGEGGGSVATSNGGTRKRNAKISFPMVEFKATTDFVKSVGGLDNARSLLDMVALANG